MGNGHGGYGDPYEQEARHRHHRFHTSCPACREQHGYPPYGPVVPPGYGAHPPPPPPPVAPGSPAGLAGGYHGPSYGSPNVPRHHAYPPGNPGYGSPKLAYGGSPKLAFGNPGSPPLRFEQQYASSGYPISSPYVQRRYDSSNAANLYPGGPLYPARPPTPVQAMDPGLAPPTNTLADIFTPHGYNPDNLPTQQRFDDEPTPHADGPSNKPPVDAVEVYDPRIKGHGRVYMAPNGRMYAQGANGEIHPIHATKNDRGTITYRRADGSNAFPRNHFASLGRRSKATNYNTADYNGPDRIPVTDMVESRDKTVL